MATALAGNKFEPKEPLCGSQKGVYMRDLIEKVLKKGLSVSFSEESGFSIIRICKGGDVVASCSLGSASFRASVEDSLQSLLLDLERKGV